MTLAAMPFITRLYGASDYGVWVIVLTLSGFFLPLATLRYDLAMVLSPTHRMAAALALAIGASTLIVAVVGGLGLLAAPQSVIVAISGLGPAYLPLVALAPLLLILLAAQNVMQAWATRERRFTALSKALMVQAVATAAATLLLPLFVGAGAAAAVSGGIIGISIGTSVLFLSCGHSLVAAARRRAPLVSARRGLVRYKVYALYVVPYSLSAGLTERLVQLLLASVYSPGVVAEFYVARQLMTAPATFIGNALRQTLFAYSTQRDSKEELKRRVDALLSLLIHMLAPTLAFGLLWLKPVAVMFFGTNWAYLPEFASWSLIVGGASLLVTWLDRVFDVLGRQGLSTNLQIATDFLVVLSLLTCVLLRLEPVQTVAVLSCMVTLVQLARVPIILLLLGQEKPFIVRTFGYLFCLTAAWTVAQYLIQSHDAGPEGLAMSVALLAIGLGHGVYARLIHK